MVICLGLTALESARDLKTLRCGIPVILMKVNDKDLFVKVGLSLPVITLKKPIKHLQQHFHIAII